MINATRTIVSINGKQKNLGYYKSQEDALKALRLVELKNSYKENSYKENKIKKNNIKNTSINRDPDTKPKNTRINSPSNIIHLFLGKNIMKKVFNVLLLWCVAIYTLCTIYTADPPSNHNSLPSFIKRDTAIRLAKIKKENEYREPSQAKLSLQTSLTTIRKTKYFKTDQGEVRISYHSNGIIRSLFEKNKDYGGRRQLFNNERKALKDAARKLNVKVAELSAREISYLNSEYIPANVGCFRVTKYFKTDQGEVRISYSCPGYGGVFISARLRTDKVHAPSDWYRGTESNLLATAARKLKIKLSELYSVEVDRAQLIFFVRENNYY